MKKAILSIIIIAVLGGGAFLFLKSDKKDTQTDTPAAQTETPAAEEPAPIADSLTVTYDGNTFTPAAVTVKPGTKVNFVNQSTNPMWVASDPHPVHTDFSAFDAQKSLGQGQTYSFTFEKPGEYGYHNHLNSGSTGTITVK